MGKRMNMRPEPWLKQMEAFDSFRGGLNTVSDQSTMADVEVRDITNVDISIRGNPQRRSGMIPHTRNALWGEIKGKKWSEL